MAAKVFGLFADDVAQPFANPRVIDVVVVDPALVARVVGRVDVDALHLTAIARQEGFEGFEVVPEGKIGTVSGKPAARGKGRGRRG